MEKPPLINIPLKGYLKQGDTISKKTITFKSGYTGDLTTATIKMQVYNNGTMVMDLTNGTGITVLSSTKMEIDEVPGEKNNLPEDVPLMGDLQIKEATGETITYFDVKYNITKQYSV